jgi:uncharacterized protein YjbI with pentapeptide repeats
MSPTAIFMLYTMKMLHPSVNTELTKPNDIGKLFDEDGSISEVYVENETLANLKLKKLSISESLISKTDLSQMSLESLDILDCRFIGCNFTASKFPNSGWRIVLIDGARCSGMQVTNSILKNITFKKSKLELVNFRFSNLENVIFEDCILNDVDFYNAKLKNVEFINCMINNITFASAKMVNVDVSKSQIEDIKGMNSLKGITISYDQLMQMAPYFATEAGIKVK